MRITILTIAIFYTLFFNGSVLVRAVETLTPRGELIIPPHRASGPVSFDGEEISLNVTANRVTVTGRYHLHSDLPGKHAVPLAYPFPMGGGGLSRHHQGVPGKGTLSREVR